MNDQWTAFEITGRPIPIVRHEYNSSRLNNFTQLGNPADDQFVSNAKRLMSLNHNINIHSNSRLIFWVPYHCWFICTILMLVCWIKDKYGVLQSWKICLIYLWFEVRGIVWYSIIKIRQIKAIWIENMHTTKTSNKVILRMTRLCSYFAGCLWIALNQKQYR